MWNYSPINCKLSLLDSFVYGIFKLNNSNVWKLTTMNVNMWYSTVISIIGCHDLVSTILKVPNWCMCIGVMYLQSSLSCDTFFINKTALNNLKNLFQWLPNCGMFFNIVLNKRLFIMFSYHRFQYKTIFVSSVRNYKKSKAAKGWNNSVNWKMIEIYNWKRSKWHSSVIQILCQTF